MPSGETQKPTTHARQVATERARHQTLPTRQTTEHGKRGLSEEDSLTPWCRYNNSLSARQQLYVHAYLPAATSRSGVGHGTVRFRFSLLQEPSQTSVSTLASRAASHARMLGIRSGTVPRNWGRLDCPYLGRYSGTYVDDGMDGETIHIHACGPRPGFFRRGGEGRGGLQTGGNHCHLLSNVSQVPILGVCVRFPWQHSMSMEERNGWDQDRESGTGRRIRERESVRREER